MTEHERQVWVAGALASRLSTNPRDIEVIASEILRVVADEWSRGYERGVRSANIAAGRLP